MGATPTSPDRQILVRFADEGNTGPTGQALREFEPEEAGDPVEPD